VGHEPAKLGPSVALGEGAGGRGGGCHQRNSSSSW
jgi:hypothetical protein